MAVRGSTHHVGKVEHRSVQVRGEVEQRGEQVAGPAADVAHAAWSRTSRARLSRVSACMRPPAAMARSNVTQRSGWSAIHSKNGAPLAAANASVAPGSASTAAPTAATTSSPAGEVDPRPPPTGWSARRKAVTLVGRTRPRRSMRTQPRVARDSAAGARAGRVGAEPRPRPPRRWSAGERVGHARLAQRHQHTVVEHPEQALEDPHGRRSHRGVDPAEGEAEAIGSHGDRRRRQERHTKNGGGSDRRGRCRRGGHPDVSRRSRLTAVSHAVGPGPDERR